MEIQNIDIVEQPENVEVKRCRGRPKSDLTLTERSKKYYATFKEKHQEQHMCIICKTILNKFSSISKHNQTQKHLLHLKLQELKELNEFKK